MYKKDIFIEIEKEKIWKQILKNIYEKYCNKNFLPIGTFLYYYDSINKND